MSLAPHGSCTRTSYADRYPEDRECWAGDSMTAPASSGTDQTRRGCHGGCREYGSRQDFWRLRGLNGQCSFPPGARRRGRLDDRLGWRPGRTDRVADFDDRVPVCPGYSEAASQPGEHLTLRWIACLAALNTEARPSTGRHQPLPDLLPRHFGRAHDHSNDRGSGTSPGSTSVIGPPPHDLCRHTREASYEPRKPEHPEHRHVAYRHGGRSPALPKVAADRLRAPRLRGFPRRRHGGTNPRTATIPSE